MRSCLSLYRELYTQYSISKEERFFSFVSKIFIAHFFCVYFFEHKSFDNDFFFG